MASAVTVATEVGHDVIRPSELVPKGQNQNEKKASPRLRAGIGPKTPIPSEKWQSGPSPGPPGGKGDKNKIKSVLKHS